MADKGATLDMSLFFGTADQKLFFCNELLRLLKLRGGVKIQNHSIPDEDISQLFDMVSPPFVESEVEDTLTLNARVKGFFLCH